MRVNTDELERQVSELQAVASRVSDIQDSVLRISRNLCREQFGVRFQNQMISAAAAIGRRNDELRRMRTALQQIFQLYEQCEMRIVDEAEHAAVHYEQSGIAFIALPELRAALGDYVPRHGLGGIPLLTCIPQGIEWTADAIPGDANDGAVSGVGVIDWTPWNR